MKVLGIDPGTTKSAYVHWDSETKKIYGHAIVSNDDLINQLIFLDSSKVDFIAIEMMQSFGMAVGASTFETLVFIGRFEQLGLLKGVETKRIPRGKIKMHHCNSMRAKDGNIAQALRDKYGEKGTKKNPGTTYGLASHMWQAFAVATYVTEGGEL